MSSDPILSTNELDALRNAVDADDLPAGAGSGDGNVLADGEGLPRYQFGEGRIVGARREERLSYVFDRAARALETRFSDILEKKCTATVTFLKVTRYNEFRESFEVDSRELAMLGFIVPGLPGSGLVVLEPEVVDKLVEALMGGAGQAAAASKGGRRSVSDLDLRVVQRMVSAFLVDLGRVWNPAEPLQPSITGADTTGVVARVYADSTPIVAGLIEVAMGSKVIGMIGVVLPRGAVDVMADPASSNEPRSFSGEYDGPLADAVPDFMVQVDVALGRRKMSVRELLALSEGDVLFLEGRRQAVGEVQGVPKLLGVPGVRNGNKAIRIADVMGRTNSNG